MIGLIGASLSNYAQRGRRNSLVGVWKLQSCLRAFEDGRTEHPFGEQPVGRIQYDLAGRMSALLMRPGRPWSVPPGIESDNASHEELRDAVTGFVAYFGTFDVDHATQTVTHHIEASLEPSWVGADLMRRFRFDGSNLILTWETRDIVDTLSLVRESDLPIQTEQ